MELATNPEWLRLGLYALGAALVLGLLFRIPVVGRLLRAAFSLTLLAVGLLALFQLAPFEPTLAGILSRVGLDGQEVAGQEVRIRMSPDGHFWARAEINGVERRMLIDSGATVTALSERTARAASVEPGATITPVLLRTANGTVAAQTGTIDRLDLAGIRARDLRVVISPGLGGVDVLGMNFLSQLASWRVEGRTLVLTPRPPDNPEPPG